MAIQLLHLQTVGGSTEMKRKVQRIDSFIWVRHDSQSRLSSVPQNAPEPVPKAKPAPRNVTSLLSSTLFVLDLYDIHSVITSQITSQLLYWIGAELFNRIMSNR
ncbi:hypothetical protein BN1723_019068, partial [Verticillium longisporum]